MEISTKPEKSGGVFAWIKKKFFNPQMFFLGFPRKGGDNYIRLRKALKFLNSRFFFSGGGGRSILNDLSENNTLTDSRPSMIFGKMKGVT